MVVLFYKLLDASVSDVHGVAFEKAMTACEHTDGECN